MSRPHVNRWVRDPGFATDYDVRHFWSEVWPSRSRGGAAAISGGQTLNIIGTVIPITCASDLTRSRAPAPYAIPGKSRPSGGPQPDGTIAKRFGS